MVEFVLRRLAMAVREATGLVVLQADQSVARPELPYLGLSRVSARDRRERPIREFIRDAPAEWDLDFSNAEVGDRVGIEVGDFEIEAVGYGSAEEARDGWLAAFEESRLPFTGRIVAEPVGADVVRLTTPEGAMPLRVRGAYGVEVDVVGERTAEVWRSLFSLRYRIQVYGSEVPEEVLERVRAALQGREVPGVEGFSAVRLESLVFDGVREVRGFVDVDLSFEAFTLKMLEELQEVVIEPNPQDA